MFAALVVCRSVHYTAALLLFGASVFVRMLAPPQLAARLESSHRRFASGAALIILATAVIWLLLEAGSMGDGWHDAIRPRTVGAVLTDTDFGRSWQVHGGLGVGLFAAVALRRRLLVCLASMMVLASLGLIGHAAMQSGPIGWLHRGNLALHLLAVGFWLGGLLPLLATMGLTHEPTMRGVAITALCRFSTAGHLAVATAVLTGIGNTAFIFGAGFLQHLSLYRILLAAKVAVVVLTIVLALVNRYWLVPRLRSRSDAARMLIRNSKLEIGLGALVVVIVSLFGLLDPYH